MNAPINLEQFAILLREWTRFACSRPDRRSLKADLETVFDRLAVSLFRLQFTHNPAYRRLCETRKLTPRGVAHWSQIPSVPAAAFKKMDLSCLPTYDRTTVFHSSATTGQQPSRHFHSATSLQLYEASLWPWFAAHLLPELVAAGVSPATTPVQLMMLTPPPADVPHSSLAHMFATVERSRKWSESVFLGELDQNGGWALNNEAAVACLQSATELKRSTLILGTAFSFVHLLDHLAKLGLRFQLPPGSRVMETGGYKGRSRALTRPELHALISERLGVPGENIVCEYGMSELSSQAYDRAASGNPVDRTPAPALRCFHFPPWARAQIISPETGDEAAEGETGLIRVFDLANVYSVLAIQTEDLGIRSVNGFELIGRARAAEPRGCSLASTSL